MRTYITEILVLSCLVAVYKAAPQDGDIDGIRRVRSINITSGFSDATKIADAISSVVKKNAAAIASEIEKKVSTGPKLFSFNSESNQDPNSPPIGFHRNGKPGKPGPGGGLRPRPSPPPTTAATTTVASAR